MTPKIRVLVWDDEPLIHTTIRLLFATMEDLHYVGEVGNAQWLMQQWNEVAPHILLMGGVICQWLLKIFSSLLLLLSKRS